MKLQSVILAGGNGYRLWPLSQKTLPKQFLKKANELSSFQQTIIRNNFLGEPLIIANYQHQDLILEQLSEVGVKGKIIFESEPKNTAISALIASFYAKSQGSDIMILLPSDHKIEPQTEYVQCIDKAARITADFKFCTIGIIPDSPNPNYGYIKLDQKIDNNLFLSSKFIEKPSKDLSLKFFKTKSYLWNSGIYVFDINFIKNKYKTLFPETCSLLSYQFKNKATNNSNIIQLDHRIFANLPTLSFDQAISEKLAKITVLRCSFKWQDLGNWEDLWKHHKKDRNQNNIQGEVLTHKVNNSYINSDADKTVAINLNNIIVIFKNGQLLVANKDSTDLIKYLVPDFI